MLTDGKGLFRKPSRMVDDKQAKESIMRMATLEFEYLMPGHGSRVEGNASERLKTFLKDQL